MINYTAIGQRIKAARKKLKISQDKIAEKLNVSVPYVSKIETGKTKPSLKCLDKICTILNIDLAFLITGIVASDQVITSDKYLVYDINSLVAECNSQERELTYRFLKSLKGH